MKLAYLINQYPRVSHSFIRREILALERRGFEIERIALRGWDAPLPDAEDRLERQRTRYVLRGGLPALLPPTIRALLRSPLRFLTALRAAARLSRRTDRPLGYHLIYLAEACRIVPWLEASGVRHVHAHFGTNSAEVALLIHALGGPRYSFTVHGPEEFLRPCGLREKIAAAAFTVAVSGFGRSQLYLQAAPADWPRIRVVRCGLDAAFYRDAPVRIPQAPRLACVGRLCVEKGQLLLVEAAARLAARGIGFELVLVGDGPLRPDIEASIRRHGLEARVRITGWVGSPEVRRQILASRASVLPSLAEGLPVVLMESMALRRPVLSTYVAGIPELVRDGESGWLFPAGSVDALTEALQACLSKSPAELAAMGERACRDVLAQHSIDRVAGELAELFRGVDNEASSVATCSTTFARI